MTNPNGQRLEIFVNPYTGEVLGSRTRERSLVGFLYTLHHQLFIGKVGEMIVGITGLLLLLIAITGVILWTSYSNSLCVYWLDAHGFINYWLSDVETATGVESKTESSAIAG